MLVALVVAKLRRINKGTTLRFVCLCGAVCDVTTVHPEPPYELLTTLHLPADVYIGEKKSGRDIGGEAALADSLSVKVFMLDLEMDQDVPRELLLGSPPWRSSKLNQLLVTLHQ